MTEQQTLYDLSAANRDNLLTVAVVLARGDLRRVATQAARRVSDATGQPADEHALGESLVSAFNEWFAMEVTL